MRALGALILVAALFAQPPWGREPVHTWIAIVAWPILAGFLVWRRPPLILLLGMLAVEAPLLAPFDPAAVHAGPARLGPSFGYWLGTDELGRDTWSRCLFGARISLGIGAISVVVATFFGSLVGLVAGWFGGVADRVLSFGVDLFLAVPRLVLLLAVLGILHLAGAARVLTIGLVLGATGWMGMARVVRAEVRARRERGFVVAAIVLGETPVAIVWRHVIPHLVPVVTALAVLSFGGAILAEASLSFLGLGVAPPTPTWGGMLSAAATPWAGVFPGIFIVWAVVGFHRLGERC